MTIEEEGRRRLFPFRKRSWPFLIVDATISNLAFNHDRCNIFPGLRYKRQKIRFRSVRKNDVGVQVVGCGSVR